MYIKKSENLLSRFTMKTKHIKYRPFPEQSDHHVWQPLKQQQQQDPPTPPADSNAVQDPFAGIDLDLLDDATRAKITEAKASFATIAKDAKEAQTLRGQVALHQTEIEKIRAQANNPNPSPLQKQQATPTLEDEIRQAYIDAGVTDQKVLEANVKLQMKVLGGFGNRLGATVGKALEPLQANDNNQIATQAFQEVRQSSQYMQNDEVAEAVWSKVQNMVKNGHAPSAEVVANFAKIAYVDFIEKNPNTPPPTPPRQMQTQQTRLTFPGAGHSSQLPIPRTNQNDSLDAETSAAVNATVGLWPKQPKGFAGAGANNGMHVTRGN